MAKKEKRGLGVGLDALFGADVPEEEAGELAILPLERVEPREGQPRDRFDEDALRELAESISRYGLLQPITVRPLADGFYQIVAGERRWRAARLAGLRELPARIVTADERRTAEMALVENLQREDLNPLEEARGYQTLIERFGLTQEEAARSVGRSRPAVANALRLLNLPPSVLPLLEEGQLSAGHARALLGLPSEALQLSAAHQIVDRGLSVRGAEQLVKRLLRELKASSEEENDPLRVDYAAVAAEQLSQKLGRRVRLIDGKRTGRIEIEFYGPEDREALLALLHRLK